MCSAITSTRMTVCGSGVSSPTNRKRSKTAIQTPRSRRFNSLLINQSRSPEFQFCPNVAPRKRLRLLVREPNFDPFDFLKEGVRPWNVRLLNGHQGYQLTVGL